MKILTQGENEMVSPDMISRPKIRSRIHPVKVMYLGVVGCPCMDHLFDGRIMLERVRSRNVLTRVSHNHNFCFDVHVNELLKDGPQSWHVLYDNSMDMNALSEKVSEQYDLDQFVAGRLQFSYKGYTRGGKEKRMVLKDSDTISGMRMNVDGIEEQLTIGDVDISV